MRKVLITGGAGFIGNALCLRLLRQGDEVVAVDNFNDYYDPALKRARLGRIESNRRFSFRELDIADRPALSRLFAEHRFDAVVNLAAQAGVRYSLQNPQAYVDANLVGFSNLLEGCRHSGVRHLVFASSSSVYGANTRLPFSEHDNVDHPVSLYAATKKANELLAHSYAHLFGLPCTGLRFFTVYGPWGRPDMAYFSFTRKILAGEPIPVFNQGRMRRDFTFIDDVIESLARVVAQPAQPDPEWTGERPDPATSYAPYRIYNIGNNQPVELLSFIRMLETCLGKTAELELLPMQDGDVRATMADVSDLERAVGFHPSTPLEQGLESFVAWYREHHGT